ncbi:ABC transporter ATP-binding protein [Bradyrhizobium commune]|uniref:ATP-binding cassette domain-containing protein n=1 Tax=Bradyrhizobium commune TaxID=83627 RepID=A0A7S9GZK0_9BRAD|nr:ATP-binding cassette domain-containing protein [Bradyrhizobium commune]QPF90700.1 ATP-binding cassette domain-containing protein [Bradyrhizobium commune]
MSKPTGIALQLKDVSKHFGGISAANHVTLSLPFGKVTGLVGPNGAGKTTMFNIITGHIRPDQGSVTHKGMTIRSLTPRAIALRGIARSFQALRLFSHMTVLENVLTVMERSPWSFLAPGSDKRIWREGAEEILRQVGLADLRDELAVDISYGEQKFLSLGRIIAMNANVWLLDEPGSGLDLSSYDRFFSVLRESVDAGVAICLIEHNLDIVRGISDEIAFLDRGTVLDQGSPDRILNDAELTAIYFGEVA